MTLQQKTALVLGGGGPAGIAWECGLLLGLRDAGIDLSRAGRIIGTSAGSIVGTHLAVLGSVEELYAAREDPIKDAGTPSRMTKLMLAFLLAKLLHRTVEGQRRLIGKSALRTNIQGEPQWLARIAGFLPKKGMEHWPERELLLTAVDVHSGQLVVWTRESAVALPVAVASSCAVPCVFPLVHVGAQAYMDGGIGTPTNALLAAGFASIVIVDPIARIMGRQSPMHVEKQKLEAQGSTVISVAFDDRLHALVGRNLMDASRGPQIAEQGREQGRRLAKELAGKLIL